jgi:hypothetical protein
MTNEFAWQGQEVDLFEVFSRARQPWVYTLKVEDRQPRDGVLHGVVRLV